ncbi:AAA family ATPase [Candidatus Thiodubiliella endoseptemdiera]|uniref:AAA family ATPase n=1 Tax=Candidatus Thiodubiliella endoseptemdiera TaxID=2738886 RepID=UPI0034DEDC4F
MSKINQIEKSLKEIDATVFHKLMDAYLAKHYSYSIVSNGAKLGENKPKTGTPDSYVNLENGNYIFIEYTTQKTSIANKFLQDLGKCFEEEKTGIPVNKIEKIILACNSDLNPSEVENLKAKCTEQNIDCMVLGNSTIANKLFNNYSNIAKEFLDISIDTGQILDYDDFIKNYNSNNFSTSLNTTLLCREKESEDLHASIKNSAIVLITGVAGIGKTKLALEVCKEYSKKNNFLFRSILNRGANIFDDMVSYFDDEKKSYLVLIDDVNRIHTALEYIQNYYGEKLKNGSIKIVATVRDYAKNRVLQTIPLKLNSSEFELQALNDDSITQIIKDEYEITNPSYLERIVNISQGNPRLALMASSIAKEKNNLDALYNVTSLYDEYFSNIKKDLEIFSKDSLLLTIVIVSFFRVVDKENQEQFKLIETIFNIPSNDFWKDVEKLHNLEIFDLYENKVVKISDQILSTYLFYKIVFFNKKIPIDTFLENLFPQYKAKFTDILNPLLNIFNSQYIVDSLKEPVNNLWKKCLNNEQNLYRVMDVFWYLKQTDILIYFREKINNIANEEFDINSLDFWTRRNTNVINDEILKQLVVFQYDNAQTISPITQLILTYFEKRPSIFLDTLQILADEYGFKYESYRRGYEKEKTLLETVWQNCSNGKNELICKLFIQICKEFLKVEFQDSKSKGVQFTLQHFKLQETDELQKIRNSIFKHLSILYKDSKYQNDIIRLIKDYPSKVYYSQYGLSEVEKWDSENIIQFIQTNFDPNIYKHTKAANECLDGFDRCNILYESSIRNKFQHPIYELEKIITLDMAEIALEEPRNKDEKTDWDEIKKDRLAKLVKNYDLLDWELLFDRCYTIFNNSSDNYKIQENLADLFCILAKQNQLLYAQVFEKYLELSNPFSINQNPTDLIDILGKEHAYKLLQKYSYNLKNSWLFRFFQYLSNDLIDKNDIKEILNLYQNSELQSIPLHVNFLENYLSIEPNIFVKVAHVLIDRANSENEYFINGIENFFNSHSGISKHLEMYFRNDLELLKQAYLLCVNKSQYFDYSSSALNKLVTLDSSFLEKFIHKKFEKKDVISSHNIHIDLKIFWSRDDFEAIFFNIIETIFDISKSKKVWRSGEILKSFLSCPQGSEDIQSKIDHITKKYIAEFSKDENKMVFIFEFISELSHGNRKEFIAYFLQKNDSYKLFKKLSFEPNVFVSSGSRVPYLQKDKEFYTSLIGFTSSINFLKHKRYLEQQIAYIEQQINSEKKRDFMEDY